MKKPTNKINKKLASNLRKKLVLGKDPIEVILVLLRFTHENFYSSCGIDFPSVTLPYINRLRKIYKSRGPKAVISWNKEVRTRFLQWWIDPNRETKGPTYRWIAARIGPELAKCGRPGIPNRKISYALTCLYSTRTMILPVSPNVDAISSASLISPRGTEAILDMANYVRRFWRELRLPVKERPISVPQSARFESYHFSTKSGPNGQAMFTSLADLSVIPKGLLDSIITVGGVKIKRYLDNLLVNLNKFPSLFPSRGEFIRKIISIPDKEGKTREIAIADYFSQTVLKPVHLYLFSILKRIPQDCTFDQGSFVDKVKHWPVFYSVDLTRATDRFPVSVISLVLRGKFPGDWVTAWQDIMVGFPFLVRERGHLDREIRYEVGQPMGAYSSWASFALAHHFIMFYCCCKLQLNFRRAPYCLLGDDIVIGNAELGKLYIELIRSLGVDISDAKTHVSVDTCEFAKRWIHRGEEVTPFPLDAVREVSKRYNLLVNVLIQEERKGFVSSRGIPGALESFYCYLKMPRTWRRDIQKKAVDCEYITRGLMGSLNASDAVNGILVAHNTRLPVGKRIPNDICTNVMKECALQMFTDSWADESTDSKRRKKGRKPWGALAFAIVMFLTDPSSGLVNPDDVPESFPVTHVHGLMEELYLRIKREAWEIDVKRSGDWPLLLRAMTMPVSDEVYVSRNQDLLTMASAGLAKVLLKRVPELLYLLKLEGPRSFESVDRSLDPVNGRSRAGPRRL